jgi:hypothetical protein
MSSRSSVLLCAMVAALCAPLAHSARADAQTDARSELQSDPLARRLSRSAAAEEDFETRREAWQSEYRALLADYQSANERAAAAAYEWRSQRKRHRLRGDTRVEARAEIDAAEQELAVAAEAIRAFHERARSEGTPPGWLYAVEDEFPLIASAVSY